MNLFNNDLMKMLDAIMPTKSYIVEHVHYASGCTGCGNNCGRGCAGGCMSDCQGSCTQYCGESCGRGCRGSASN